MSGGWALNVTASGVAGNAYERHHIVTAARDSVMPSRSVVPGHYVLSPAELLRRMGAADVPEPSDARLEVREHVG
jgi:hypothetical protein